MLHFYTIVIIMITKKLRTCWELWYLRYDFLNLSITSDEFNLDLIICTLF